MHLHLPFIAVLKVFRLRRDLELQVSYAVRARRSRQILLKIVLAAATLILHGS